MKESAPVEIEMLDKGQRPPQDLIDLRETSPLADLEGHATIVFDASARSSNGLHDFIKTQGGE